MTEYGEPMSREDSLFVEVVVWCVVISFILLTVVLERCEHIPTEPQPQTIRLGAERMEAAQIEFYEKRSRP